MLRNSGRARATIGPTTVDDIIDRFASQGRRVNFML